MNTFYITPELTECENKVRLVIKDHEDQYGPIYMIGEIGFGDEPVTATHQALVEMCVALYDLPEDETAEIFIVNPLEARETYEVVDKKLSAGLIQQFHTNLLESRKQDELYECDCSCDKCSPPPYISAENRIKVDLMVNELKNGLFEDFEYRDDDERKAVLQLLRTEVWGMVS